MFRPVIHRSELLIALQVLKSVIMVAVKGPRPPSPEPPGYQAPPPPPLKKLWSAQRRKITPKIGQLTDDDREIARIVSYRNQSWACWTHKYLPRLKILKASSRQFLT